MRMAHVIREQFIGRNAMRTFKTVTLAALMSATALTGKKTTIGRM